MTSAGHGEICGEVLVEGNEGAPVVGFPAPDLGGRGGGRGEEAAEGEFVVGGGVGLLHAGEVHLEGYGEKGGSDEEMVSVRYICRTSSLMTSRFIKSSQRQ